MSDSFREKIFAALHEAIKPIARALLRSGISFREFSDVAKGAFVQVATEDYGIRGRPTNISRVAVMTGLTRKEVKRIRDVSLDNHAVGPSRRSPPADLLHFWHTDPDYCTVDGLPKVLPFEGKEISFVSLVRRCAGDIPPGAMRTELKRIGAIEEHEDGSLQALNRFFIPVDADQRLEIGLRMGIGSLASTIAFNSDPDRPGPTRFQRVTDSSWIDPDAVPKIQKTLTNQLEEFMTSFDSQMSELEMDYGKADKSGKKRIGIGLYFFIDD
jgi:hypothetical protein